MRFIKFKNGVETQVLKDYHTFPRRGNCATKILLNVKNLLVKRGLNEENEMIGPLQYFGYIDPYKYPKVDEIKENFEPPFKSYTFNWKSNCIKNTKNNLFQNSGKLVLDVNVIDIPIVSLGYDFSSFKVRLVKSENVTYDLSCYQTNMQVISYYFGKNYATFTIENEDGLFLEKHPFIQSMTPLHETSRGFVIVGRIHEDEIDLLGIKIPFGYTLLVDSFAIHGDSTLIGLYGMEMTADHIEMAKSDTVFLKNKHDENVSCILEEDNFPVHNSISHHKFKQLTSNSRVFIKKIFNPIF